MRVLVTGAAGSLGRVITLGLVELGHDVVGLDLVPAPEGAPYAWHEADCADADAVAAVFAEERLDAVVHLAGAPEEVSLPDELTSHVITTAALLDAMVAHRVPRIVYASSNHAVGRTPRSDGELTDTPSPVPTPTTASPRSPPRRCCGSSPTATASTPSSCRIGSFLEQPDSVRGLSTWLSHGDGVRMVEAALTAPAPATPSSTASAPTPAPGGTSSPAARLGYEPQDDAEDFADRVEPGPDDEAEAELRRRPVRHWRRFHRPALGD